MARLVSIICLCLLVAFGMFVLGLVSARSNNSAYRFFNVAVAAIKATLDIEDSALPPDWLKAISARPDADVTQRFRSLSSTGQPILVPGGVDQFVELCGAPGCLAVKFARDGSVIHKWPFRVSEILTHPAVENRPLAYQGKDIRREFTVVSLQSYENGDLLVSFAIRNAFPYGAGLARIRPDGKVVWRRNDYSHHWSILTSDGITVAPGYETIERPSVRQVNSEIRPYVRCDNVQFQDTIQIIEANGTLRKRIHLLDLIKKDERYRSLLVRTTDTCDPLHLNYVDVATEEDASTLDWIEAGDFLVSMRNISALAVVARDGTELKSFIRGSFSAQHSAQFLRDGTIILFDNMGSDQNHFPSRVLRIDLKTRSESVLFGQTSRLLPDFFTATAGNISLSQDRRRAWLAFTRSGQAAEIELATGTVLSRYDHLHSPASIGGRPGYFRLYGIWQSVN